MFDLSVAQYALDELSNVLKKCEDAGLSVSVATMYGEKPNQIAISLVGVKIEMKGDKGIMRPVQPEKRKMEMIV
jgi:hypothetical protein